MSDTGAGRAVVLELRRVSKVYRQGAAEVHALRDATLSVEAGSMVAVRLQADLRWLEACERCLTDRRRTR